MRVTQSGVLLRIQRVAEARNGLWFGRKQSGFAIHVIIWKYMDLKNISSAKPFSYDKKTRFLHWVSAGFVLLLWSAGEFLDWFPKGTPRITVRSSHIALGVLLGVLLVFRVIWRRHGGSQLPPVGSGSMVRASSAGHHLLYALIAAMVVSGIALVWIRGDNLFNLVTVPAFDPGNKALRHDAKELHGWFANALLILAGLHAAVAIWHQLVLKDGLLRRMWPASSDAHPAELQ